MRANRAKRKKTRFKKQPGTNPWAGIINNQCRCNACRAGRY